MRTFRFRSLTQLERCMEDLEVADSLMDYEEDVDALELTIYDEDAANAEADIDEIIAQHDGNEITDASR